VNVRACNLNIAAVCSKKSLAERGRLFEISLIEIDAVLDLCESLNYNKKENLQSFGEFM